MNDANELFSDAYSVVDFKILKNFSFNNYDISISSGIKNLFDKKYTSVLLLMQEVLEVEIQDIIIQVYQEIILYL